MLSRDAPRVKNPGGQVVLGGDNVSPLVEIGLTDPPKSGGGAAAPPASHLVACLQGCRKGGRIWWGKCPPTPIFGTSVKPT